MTQQSGGNHHALNNGNASVTYDLLVQTPADYTFKRPLGKDL